MRNVLLLFCALGAGGSSLAIEACSSSSSSDASDAAVTADAASDCAPLPTSVIYDCAPVASADIADAGLLVDGGEACPPAPTSDAQAFYPLGCGAILPTAVAGNNIQTGCSSPLSCTCLTGAGAGGAAAFSCPN